MDGAGGSNRAERPGDRPPAARRIGREAVAWIAAGALCLGAYFVAFGVLNPTLRKAGRHRDAIGCQSNLRELHAAAVRWAAREGKLPASIDALEAGEAGAHVGRCPDDPGPGPSYEIVEGGKRLADLPPGTVIIREVRASHGGRRNGVHADGAVEVLPAAGAEGGGPALGR